MEHQILGGLRTFVLSGKFSQEYWHMEIKKPLLDKQKGCRRQSRGTKDQLMIDKMLMKNVKRRMTTLNVAWRDYKKAYNLIPHTWNLQYLKICNVADNVKNLKSQ